MVSQQDSRHQFRFCFSLPVDDNPRQHVAQVPLLQINRNEYKQLITIKLTFSSLWKSSPASPPSSRSLIFLHRGLDSCQLATECQCHHPLISWVSIVAWMEAVKFPSPWTLSFSFHPLYWVMEGRVAKVSYDLDGAQGPALVIPATLFFSY